MDVFVQVKEEPVHEQNKGILTRPGLPNRDPVNQSNHHSNSSTKLAANEELLAEHVKMEPTEISSENGKDEKKRKRLSSTLAKILNSKQPSETQKQPVTIITSSRHSSLLYGLLNGPKLPLNPDVSQLVKPVGPNSHGTSVSDQGKQPQKTTLGLKSPLLSSMLKNTNGLIGQAKTNVTIDNLFSNTIGSVSKPKNVTLSEMLGHRKRSNTDPAPSAKPCLQSNLNQTQPHQLAKIHKMDNNVVPVDTNNQIGKDLKQFQQVSTDNGAKSTENETKDDLINVWTNVITQRVISDFSKDVNHTLNSFVKKAIIDKIKTSLTPKLTEIGSGGVQLPEELTKVSSLASSMLKTLAEGRGLPKTGVNGGDPNQHERIEKREITPPTNVIEINSDDDDIAESQTPLSGGTCGNLSLIETLRKNTIKLENNLLNQTNHIPSPSNQSNYGANHNSHLKSDIKNIQLSSNTDQNKITSKSAKDRTVVTCTYDQAGNMVIKNEKLPDHAQSVSEPVQTKNQEGSPTTKTTEISPALSFLNIQHVRDKDGKFLIFSCNICGKRFQHHGTLVVHKRTHLMESGRSDFVCDICGKVCTAERYLQVHMRTHERDRPVMPNKEREKGTFPCDVCNKTFTSDAHLSIHKRHHLGLKLYVCHICETSFTRKSQLEIHLRIHSGEKPYKCTTCGKCFSQYNGLNTHVKIHKETKPYNCELCGQGFTRKAHYERHMRKEKGVRPFNCSQCGKGFLDKTSLKTHKRVHETINSHFCKECSKGFKTENGLQSHMKFHSGEKGFDCEHCFERFELRKQLTNHMIAVHKEEAWDLQLRSYTRRSSTRSYSETYTLSDEDDDDDETDHEDISFDDNEDSKDTDESDDENKNNDLGYSNMVSNIKEDLESCQDTENILNDHEIGVSEKVKIEPVELEYDTLKIQFHEHDLMNFDPSVVKDEPPDISEEEMSSFSQVYVAENGVNLNSSSIKSEHTGLKW